MVNRINTSIMNERISADTSGCYQTESIHIRQPCGRFGSLPTAMTLPPTDEALHPALAAYEPRPLAGALFSMAITAVTHGRLTQRAMQLQTNELLACAAKTPSLIEPARRRWYKYCDHERHRIHISTSDVGAAK